MKRFVVIVAGGKGVRMGNAVPKQFLLLNGKPVLQRSLEAFATFDPTMTCIVVLPETQISYWKDLCEKYFCKVPHVVVSGGQERFDSVKNGLNAISTEGIVAVHDGVRPLVTMEMLREGFETAEKFGSAVPYVDSVDSLRMIDGEKSKTLDRTKIKRIQTPQIFDVCQLKDVMAVEYRPEFTDEASVWELAGKTLYFYKGSEQNIKITTPSDLKIAEVLL